MNQLRDKSVLIIDDDLAMLRALKKVLGGEGWTVICAASLVDAIGILGDQKSRIDLVVTDLLMPNIPGITGLHGIHHLFPALPVIVLTACSESDVRDECLSRGASAFLVKPLDAPHLLSVVRTVCLGLAP
jgi:CheY-like chemotaxis protein